MITTETNEHKQHRFFLHKTTNQLTKPNQPTICNTQDDGNWHYGMYIENGRIKDTPDYPLRTAMREIANMHTGTLFCLSVC